DDIHVVQAWINPDTVDSLLALSGVVSLDLPAYGVLNTGSVNSAGDGVLRAGLERSEFGFTGTTVKVGVISDGVTHRANVGTDLPTVTVNSSLPGTGDEGTAMLEIVHDLAPEAQLYFSSGSGLTTANMLNSITYLRNQGCKVIVDDITWFNEPYFADGAVATA